MYSSLYTVSALFSLLGIITTLAGVFRLVQMGVQ